MIITRNKNTSTTNLENECIVLHKGSGQYFGLEGALKELWMEIEEDKKDTKDIVLKWKSKFDQDESELSLILNEMIENLIENELLNIEDDICE
ncbi:PqqD family peptide modification chaperone [Bacillus sp. Xin]|uniref:PqqD family peptide modification chaperone n=1 Tax=unclassified Bacillus (in: firmicutes) TaxID=185979 RepID=UPI001574CF1E|nr:MULTISPECIES: PqqD family peptide modification chaperone [unclassified Bacillus (in: firmicutes)]MBC6973537.1 PqqD family peptide modification chaperone [Bacillus sp. Xin]NSW39494.1 PqqD family peptide modification chaperone [Bacillus sp. Xin1]